MEESPYASPRPRGPVDDSFPARGIASPAPSLGMWDAASIIVGIVVGTAIFKSPTLVFQNAAGPWHALGVWLLGGALCLNGAVCYAELATAYPRNGGDYEYLGRALGRWLGFLFGWAQLTVVLTASIAAMAYAFADYAAVLVAEAGSAPPPLLTAGLAIAAVTAVTLVNLAGMVAGKLVQNVLTGAKVLGLAAVVVAGFAWGDPGHLGPGAPTRPLEGPGFGLALVFVLYAFGGWNDAVFVTAEVRDVRKNLPRALIVSITGVTALYLAVNAAFLLALGFDGARQTYAPAADTVAVALGDFGRRAVSALVMVSALGAINGMTLAGARLYATVGEDHRVFGWLARRKAQAPPVAALLAQGIIAVLMIGAVGTPTGTAALDAVLTAVWLRPLPWEEYFGGFETLVAATAPVFWLFFLLTGVSIFVLRAVDANRERPFPIPFYPAPPIVFCLMCGYMLYSSVAYAKALSLIGVVPLVVGLPLYLLSRERRE